MARDVSRTVRFIRHVGAARFASRQPAVALCACSRLRIKAPSVWHADGSARKARGVAVDATSPHSHTLEHTHRPTILDSSFLTPSQTTLDRVLYLQSPFPEPLAPQETCRKRRVCGRIYGSACYFPRASFNSSIKLKPSRRLCHFRRDLWLGNLAPPGGSKGSVIQRLWVGTKAPPRPHCGTQAARALLLGPGGSPEQGCGPLERWGAHGLQRAR